MFTDAVFRTAQDLKPPVNQLGNGETKCVVSIQWSINQQENVTNTEIS